MGLFLGPDDLYIGSLLEMLNLIFGKYEPDPRLEGDYGDEPFLNGIDEVRAIQQEFGIFKPGRPLVESLRVLGAGGLMSPSVKRKWYRLLRDLDSYDSNVGPKGGAAIVDALIAHLKAKAPLPVYFKAHYSGDKVLGRRVYIDTGRPVPYMSQEYLTVSIPMKPRDEKFGAGPDPKGPKGPKAKPPAGKSPKKKPKPAR
ncbi:MAG: hypothetical protein KKC85_03515 [Gammaproteobacteria bacterium]|nr:hypothetical protein [Gammaproteobacteria bacterium]